MHHTSLTDFLDRFPTWRYAGAWPYELGVALLMLWLAESVRHLENISLRYPPDFWDHVLRFQTPVFAALWLVSLFLLFGFWLRELCKGCSYVLRVSGLAATGCVFAYLAYIFLRAFPYSIAGGMGLFLSWRSFAVAAALFGRWRRCSHGNRVGA